MLREYGVVSSDEETGRGEAAGDGASSLTLDARVRKSFLISPKTL
jgi:hypothetical protein